MSYKTGPEKKNRSKHKVHLTRNDGVSDQVRNAASHEPSPEPKYEQSCADEVKTIPTLSKIDLASWVGENISKEEPRRYGHHPCATCLSIANNVTRSLKCCLGSWLALSATGRFELIYHILHFRTNLVLIEKFLDVYSWRFFLQTILVNEIIHSIFSSTWHHRNVDVMSSLRGLRTRQELLECLARTGMYAAAAMDEK